jgi:hypothetical protein
MAKVFSADERRLKRSNWDTRKDLEGMAVWVQSKYITNSSMLLTPMHKSFSLLEDLDVCAIASILLALAFVHQCIRNIDSNLASSSQDST